MASDTNSEFGAASQRDYTSEAQNIVLQGWLTGYGEWHVVRNPLRLRSKRNVQQFALNAAPLKWIWIIPDFFFRKLFKI